MRNHTVVRWRGRYLVVAMDGEREAVITDECDHPSFAETTAILRDMLADRVAWRQTSEPTYLDPACYEAAYSERHVCYRSTGEPLRPGETCFVEAAAQLAGATRGETRR